jgi:crotonobetainyl-CoA:carnitine CoA-transferase CaiB-like acyl-CoA transferase
MLPLSDVRVLDLSRVLAGPFATMLLGDLGADVIKVEQPGRGDDTRHWGPPFAGGESAYFLAINRNKRSITADLKHPQDVRRVLKLASKADIIIENFRRGTQKALGIDYDSVRSRNQRIIYCSISSFGPGRDENQPGYDFLIQARGGVMGITGHPDGEPTKVGVAVVDMICGLYAANAILAAVHARAKTGHGCYIEVPLYESQVSWLTNRAQAFLISGKDPGRLGNTHPSIMPYETFHAGDKMIAVAVGNDLQFRVLCKVIEHQELANDKRFEQNPDRVKNRDELGKILSTEFAKQPAHYWITRLQAAGVPCGPVSSLAEVFSDPHLLSSGLVQEIHHPIAGKLRTVASPILIDGERLPIRRPPPTLGQHDREVEPDAWDTL